MATRDVEPIAQGTEALAWSDLELILAICRAESLSGAARILGVNHSTVSRKINAIEDKTGVRFFHRMPNGYFMTEAGEAVLEHGEKIEAEVQELGRRVLGKDMALSGRIRLTCSEGLAVELVPSMVAEFRARHPNVAVHIEPKHSVLDLSRSEAEVAIRYTKTPPETAFGRRVCGFRAALYSSRQYLARMNGIPLTEHSWCIAADTANWLVPTILPSMDLVRRNTVFSSGSPQAVINAVAAGQGTMVMACNLADTDRRLVRVSENLQHLNMDVWVLTHADLRRTARIRALMAHLCEGLHAKRAEFNGDVRAGGTELLF